MSVLGVRRGGASSRTMFFAGMNCLMCLMMFVWSCLVCVGVRASLCFVRRASFVSVWMITMSCCLKFVCLIASSVCERVKVACILYS